MNPINYTLKLDPNLTDFTFAGKVGIQLTTQTPITTITLNALDLTIHDCRIMINEVSQPCRFKTELEKEALHIKLPEEISGTFQLVIDYTGRINDKMAGFYRSGYGPEGDQKYIAVTQFQESDARRAFPCLDHPVHKATFDIEIVLDENLIAVSNTPIKSTVPDSNGKKRVYFHRTPKMSTYLLFFGIGDFDIKEDTRDGRVRSVVLPGREAHTGYGLAFGTRALRFCEEYFNIPYPLSKLDLIAIPDFAFGAMENWGAITFRENLLLYYPDITSKSGEERICEVIAHEIVHQWFGNLVTPSDWKYLWLNESFATYFGYGVVEHYYPEWDIWDQFLDTMTAAALERDSLNATFPIELPGDEHVAINSATAPIIYNKGGSILRQIEGHIGAENFKKGLRDYLEKHAYECAASHHLWEAFDRASEMPILQMMKSWIEQPGHPVIDAERNGDTLSLTQRRFTYLSNDFNSIWQIPVTIRVFDSSGGAQTITTLLDKKTTEVKIGGNAIAYKLNEEQTGFYRTHFMDRDNLKKLGSFILKQQLSPKDRWGIERDLFALVKSGNIDLDSYLDFLSNYRHESAYLPLNSIAGNLYYAYLIFEGDIRQKTASVGQSLFESMLSNIGYEPVKEEAFTLSLLRDRIIWHALLYGSKTAETFTRDQIEKLFSDQNIHPDILKSIMQAGAFLESEKAYEWLKKKFKESDSEHERMNVLIALGCFRDDQMTEDALRFTLDDVPERNKFIPIMSAAANPHTVSFMWEWYLSHKGELESLHPLLYERVLSAIIPVCGLKDPTNVNGFFTDYIKTHTNLKDTILMSLEKLEINARLRGTS